MHKLCKTGRGAQRTLRLGHVLWPWRQECFTEERKALPPLFPPAYLQLDSPLKLDKYWAVFLVLAARVATSWRTSQSLGQHQRKIWVGLGLAAAAQYGKLLAKPRWPPRLPAIAHHTLGYIPFQSFVAGFWVGTGTYHSISTTHNRSVRVMSGSQKSQKGKEPGRLTTWVPFLKLLWPHEPHESSLFLVSQLWRERKCWREWP